MPCSTEYMRQLRAERRDAWDALFQQVLDYKCVDCGNENPVVLEFHHLDPSKKEFKIGDARQGALTKDRVAKALREASKCVVLCANCHRIRHHEQMLTKLATSTGTNERS